LDSFLSFTLVGPDVVLVTKLNTMLERKMEADRFRDLISRIYKKDEVDAWLKKASDKAVMEAC
jgi:hypothetical protein